MKIKIKVEKEVEIKSGWGDYIIMDIDANGKIANFSFSIGDFM